MKKLIVKSTDLQVFVLSPDRFWYPQGPLAIDNGRWQVEAIFGSQDSGDGSEFAIAALSTDGTPRKEKVRDLPAASGRSTVRVIRKSTPKEYSEVTF